MALSEQTLDHLLEAEGNIRAAIKCAAVNENPLVITQISKLLYGIEVLPDEANGGETEFVNMFKVYKALDKELKTKLEYLLLQTPWRIVLPLLFCRARHHTLPQYSQEPEVPLALWLPSHH